MIFATATLLVITTYTNLCWHLYGNQPELPEFADSSGYK
jgi:hypothetical protein